MTGHSNIKKTLRKTREVTYWDIMIKDINKYVLECDTC